MTEETLKKALVHLIPIALLIGIIAGLYIAKEEEIKDLENGEILFEHFAVKVEELEE